jgi:hypothetical protein
LHPQNVKIPESRTTHNRNRFIIILWEEPLPLWMKSILNPTGSRGANQAQVGPTQTPAELTRPHRSMEATRLPAEVPETAAISPSGCLTARYGFFCWLCAFWILAQVSRSDTVRLNTGFAGEESGSTQK